MKRLRNSGLIQIQTMILLLLMGKAALADVNFSIGTVAPGESVTITYDVTIGNPLSTSVTQISSQGTVSGGNFTSINTDDPETTAPVDATITSLQNDAPVVTAGNAIAYTEQNSPVAISPALTVSDVDSLNLVGATVSVSSGFVSGDTLAFANQNGITGGYNIGTGVLTLSGSAASATYQSALRTVTFSSASDNPTANGSHPSRTISFVVSDGLVNSAAATTTINITALNDPPVLTAGNTITYTENGAPLAISPGLTVTDADNLNLAGASVSISSGLVSGDILGFTGQNGISGSYSSGTGILTLSGSSSVGNYQTAQRSVTYFSSSDNPTANGASPSRTITFVVTDGTDPSNTATSTINVTAVNDNPVAVDDTILRAPNDDTKVQVSLLLANDTDPESDALTITGVNSPSVGGATVTLSGDWIYYIHHGTVADTFTYSISDGHGGTATGTVHVDIQNPDTESSAAIEIAVDGSGAHLTFNGIPGRSYVIQFRDVISDPWQDQGTASLSLLGVFHYDDPAGTPMRFYRYVFR